MNSHIINEDVRSTLSWRIEALCPWAIPKEKIEEIINQLWRDAL